MTDKFKRLLDDTELFTAFLLIIVALLSFQLGKMSAEKADLKAREAGKGGVAEIHFAGGEEEAETYVGSANSNKYHLPWCAGAERIKEENKIIFGSKQEAEEAGYEPAANCKGI